MAVGLLMEKTITIQLAELKTIRFVCAACGGVAEIPTERLTSLTRQPRCPACAEQFDTDAPGPTIADLKSLGTAMQKLIGRQGYSVEFVLPAPCE